MQEKSIDIFKILLANVSIQSECHVLIKLLDIHVPQNGTNKYQPSKWHKQISAFKMPLRGILNAVFFWRKKILICI